MSGRRSDIRLFTPAEAEQVLPQVLGAISALRALRKRIIRLQTQVDIEELTAGGKAETRDRVEELLGQIEAEVESFHQGMADLHGLGCELKDLEKGLVDFYAERDGKVVYLCWMEGEEHVRFWHGLDEGFLGRKAL